MLLKPRRETSTQFTNANQLGRHVMKQETAVATEVEPETASNNNFQPAPERKRNRGLSEDKRFKIFAGSANRQLAEEICKQIGVPLGETKIQRFADGEIYFQLLENVRGVDVFVVQPTCNPVDRTWWSC